MGIRVAKKVSIRMGMAYKHPRKTKVKVAESDRKFFSRKVCSQGFGIIFRLKSLRLAGSR